MEYKVCFKCGKKKPLSEFYKHKGMKDGHLNKCKECAKKDSRNNHRTSSKYEDSYDKTEKGVIRVIYKTQKLHSKDRGHPLPAYSKKELAEWMYKNGFKELYNNWVKNGYDNKLKPSIDRLDDNKPYTFDNIRLVTWQENIEHRLKYIRKKVYCLDENFNLLKIYNSITEAINDVGYSFRGILNKNKTDRKNKFYWFTEKEYKEKFSNI
jgi:hypothetical protein